MFVMGFVMGDMREEFDALKAWKTERRDVRRTDNAAQLAELGVPIIFQSKGVYRLETHQGAVMYYSASNTWQHKGRVGRGTPEQFKAWLQKNSFLQ